MGKIDSFLVIFVVIIWGFNFVVIKWGVEDIDPYMMTALRFLLTALPVIFFVKKPNVHINILALYGIIFGAGLWGVVNYAISLGIPSGLSSLILQASAFMSVIAGVLLFKEEISYHKSTGIVLALIGFLIIIYENAGVETSLYGILLVLFSSLSWTVCNIIIKKHNPDNVISFIAWSSLFIPIPILILAYIDYGNNFASLFTNIGIQGYISILFQAFITTLLGYSLWIHAINKHGLSVVAPYSLLVPISGLFFGWLIYGETLNTIEMIGSLIIFTGLLFNSEILKKI